MSKIHRQQNWESYGIKLIYLIIGLGLLMLMGASHMGDYNMNKVTSNGYRKKMHL